MSPGFHPTCPADPSIHAAVTTWALQAVSRVLWLLLGLGLPGALVLLLTGWQHRPFSAPFLTASAIGAWGLIGQRARQPKSHLVSLVQWCLAAIGILMALTTGLGLLLWVMGPAPIR